MTLTNEFRDVLLDANAMLLSDAAGDLLARIPFLPTNALSLPDGVGDVLSSVGIIEPSFTTVEKPDGAITTQFSTELLFATELALDIPGLSGFSLVFASNAGRAGSRIKVVIEWGGDYKLTIAGKLALRFSRDVLKPVEIKDGETKVIEGKSAEIGFEGEVSIDGTGQFSFGIGGLGLDRAMIGDSGILVGFHNAVLVLSDDLSVLKGLPEASKRPSFLIPGWRGLYIGDASITLPTGIQQEKNGKKTAVTVAIENAYLGHGGFSCDEISAKFDPALSASVGGFTARLSKVSLGFRQNALTRGQIDGSLKVPFFEKEVDVSIGFALDGSFLVKLGAKDGLITLSKEGVIDVTLESLALSRKDGIFTFTLSGGVKPTLLGKDVPSFHVQALSIDSTGRVAIEGGFIDLREKYTIDFSGFAFEISKIGFGKNENGGKWVGFSGGIRLIESLPAGVSVEGLRITWYDEGGRGPEVSFRGIAIELAVPDVFSFKGAVDYGEVDEEDDDGKPKLGPDGKVLKATRFDGDIRLDIKAIGLVIDAKLVVGIANGYNFFAIYLGVELPAGIPLWATGLALYGVAGLFAYNMEPNKRKSEEWYGGLTEGGGYYVRDPIGITSLRKKWKGKDGSLAFGAGVTIGTVFDNGYTFAGKFLFVLVFPGPIILFEGKTNLFKQRSKLDEEPVFRTLVVLDFREGSFTCGLSVDFKYGSEGELVTLGGGVEIYYNSAKADDWHIWIGKKEPRTKRIRANIFRIWGMDFYLMVDAKQFAMGSWTGIEVHYDFGPVGVELEAWLEWNVLVNYRPAQLHGDVWLHGKIAIHLGPIGLALSADARLDADVFNPYHIVGTVKVQVDLPWPLPDFGFDVGFEWGPQPDPPPLPSPLAEISLEHPKSTVTWPMALGQRVVPKYEAAKPEDPPGPGLLEVTSAAEVLARRAGIDLLPPPSARSGVPVAEYEPVVPLDVRPVLTFNRPVHDDGRIGAYLSNPSPEYELIGDPAKGQGPAKVRYSLKSIVFHTWEGGSWVPAESMVWDDIAYRYIKDAKVVHGTWAPVPASPVGATPIVAQTKLQVYQRNPLAFARGAATAWGNWLFDDFWPKYPCAPRLPIPEIEVCDFDDEANSPRLRSPWGFSAQPALRLFWSAPLVPTIEERDAIAGHRRLFVAQSEGAIEVLLELPRGVNRVEIVLSARLDVPSANVALEVRGIDARGAEPLASVPTGVDTLSLDAGRESIVGVVIRCTPQFTELRGLVELLLAQISLVRRIPLEDEERAKQGDSHLRTQLRRWADTGEVFLPGKRYRMTVTTAVFAQGIGVLEGFSRSLELPHYLYFRTEGPPGLSTLSRPDNTPAPGTASQAGAATFDQTMGGLADLSSYVHQTIPPTIAQAGSRPALPVPFYRGYDLGVEYNENYVDLMYRLAGRDLGLRVYDDNARPVLDENGVIASFVNRRGRVDEVRLSETDTYWTSRVRGGIAAVDTFSVKRNDTIGAVGPVLPRRAKLEARLVGALLHEDFARHEGTAGISGPNASLGRFTVSNEQSIGGDVPVYSHWQVERSTVDGHAVFHLAQGAAYAQGGVDDLASTLWYNAPDLEEWTDYRVRATLRTRGRRAGGMGLVFRYRPAPPSGMPSCYLFSMNESDRGSSRRLVRVDAGKSSFLTARDGVGFELDRDYEVVIDVTGPRITVVIDGELALSWTDEVAPLKSGTIGLHAFLNAGALFADVVVEDHRANAPVMYRYAFQTSRYVNFRHHLHDFQDESWSARATSSVSGQLALAVPPTAPPTDEEARAFDALAQLALGSGAAQPPSRVEVVRVEQSDAAGSSVAALLLRSPERMELERVSLDLERTRSPRVELSPPSELKIVGTAWHDEATGSLNDEWISLLARDAIDISGMVVEVRRPGSEEEGNEPWLPYYTFGNEPLIPAGAIVVVHGGRRSEGPSEATRLLRRYLEQAPGFVEPRRLARYLVEVRLRFGDRVLHHALFASNELKEKVGFLVLRKQDGAEFALVKYDRSHWESGYYQLTLTYRRDNRSVDPRSVVLEEAGQRDDERVTLMIPVFG